MIEHRKIAYQAGLKKDWDKFREVYDYLDIEDLVWMNTRWDAVFPYQDHATSAKFVEMFWMLRGELRFAELGCYRGALYKKMYEALPYKIKDWVGFDVNHAAIADTRKLMYTKFTGVELKRWFWEVDVSGFDAFVSSHTLEHFRWAQAKKVLKNVSCCKFLLLELPFRQSWKGYYGSHVLDAMKADFEEVLEETHEKFFEDSEIKKNWVVGWVRRGLRCYVGDAK